MESKLFLTPLKPTDYEDILVEWWHDWNWTPPLKDFLPEDGTGGLIVWDKNMPICAGFVYTTNSRVAWIDWIISNKKYKDRPKRKEALKLLVLNLESLCKKADAKFAYALIKHEGLIKTYEDVGFVAGDRYNKEMIKTL